MRAEIESAVATIKLRGGPRLAVTQIEEDENGVFTVYINAYPAVTDKTLDNRFGKIGLMHIGTGWNHVLGDFLRLKPMSPGR